MFIKEKHNFSGHNMKRFCYLKGRICKKFNGDRDVPLIHPSNLSLIRLENLFKRFITNINDRVY